MRGKCTPAFMHHTELKPFHEITSVCDDWVTTEDRYYFKPQNGIQYLGGRGASVNTYLHKMCLDVTVHVACQNPFHPAQHPEELLGPYWTILHLKT